MRLLSLSDGECDVFRRLRTRTSRPPDDPAPGVLLRGEGIMGGVDLEPGFVEGRHGLPLRHGDEVEHLDGLSRTRGPYDGHGDGFRRRRDRVTGKTLHGDLDPDEPASPGANMNRIPGPEGFSFPGGVHVQGHLVRSHNLTLCVRSCRKAGKARQQDSKTSTDFPMKGPWAVSITNALPRCKKRVIPRPVVYEHSHCVLHYTLSAANIPHLLTGSH